MTSPLTPRAVHPGIVRKRSLPGIAPHAPLTQNPNIKTLNPKPLNPKRTPRHSQTRKAGRLAKLPRTALCIGAAESCDVYVAEASHTKTFRFRV